MVKVDASAQPTCRREADFLIVLLHLTSDPDAVWKAIFDARSNANSLESKLLIDSDGHVAAAVTVPWSTSDEDAKSLIRKLAEFVDEVEEAHARRVEAFDRLERAITQLFEPPPPVT